MGDGVAGLGGEERARRLGRGVEVGEQAVVGQPVCEVVGAVDDAVPEGRVAQGRGELVVVERVVQRGDRRRGRALGAAARGVDADAEAQLEHRAQVLGVAGGERQLGEEVEAAGRAPVEHARRAAVGDLDEPGLLQALDGLADRVAVALQLGRQHPFGGQRLPGGRPAGEDPVAEADEDRLGEGRGCHRATGCTSWRGAGQAWCGRGCGSSAVCGSSAGERRL